MAASTNSINIFFNDVIANDKLVSSTLAQKRVSFTWTITPNLKTIIVYDQDAPYPPPRNVNSPFVHMLAVNVKDDITETVFSYMPPSPPADSEPHTYFVELYHQTGPVSLRPRTERAKFDVYKFALNNNMTLVARTVFKVGHSPEITTPTATVPSHPDEGINFKSTSTLTEEQKKHCRCRLKAAAKNPGTCNLDKAWGQGKCYNPYAVCSRAGSRVRSCGKDYDFDTMADKYLIAYAALHNVEAPVPYDREHMIQLAKDIA